MTTKQKFKYKCRVCKTEIETTKNLIKKSKWDYKVIEKKETNAIPIIVRAGFLGLRKVKDFKFVDVIQKFKTKNRHYYFICPLCKNKQIVNYDYKEELIK